MRIHPSDIVRTYLLFPPRVQGKAVALGHPVLDPQKEPFQHELRRLYPSYRTDDLFELTRQAFFNHPRLVDWYRACLQHSNITINFRDAAPRIAWRSFTDWRFLTFRLDPDALVTLSFVQYARRAPDRADLCNWGIHVLADNRDLDRLYKQGITDIHTHLEGCESIPILWQELMWGRIRAETLPEYRPGRLRSLQAIADQAGTPDLVYDLEIDIRAIHDARRLWGCQLGKGPDQLDGDPSPHPSSLSKALWRERHLLAQAWLELDAGKYEGAAALDTYLFAKSRFLSRHHQYPGGNPGLENFRRYYDRVKPGLAKKSEKAQKRRLSRLIGTSTESPHLHCIEFRIRPELHMGSYARFLSDWHRRFGKAGHLRGKVSFVVHFIRWADRDRPDGDGQVPHELLRRELDLQSAALHLFRIRHQDKLARYVTGIDVANKERLCPVDIFSPYLRLLRGIFDETDVNALMTSKYLSHWQGVRRQGMIYLPALPRLGLTYHAGEDFYHPLDGIRTIWNAIEYGQMQPGDRIGHGLAAGTNIGEFHHRYGRSILIPYGEAIDSLAWLHQQIQYLDGFGESRQVIEMYLAVATNEVYECSVSPPTLCMAKQARHELPDLAARKLPPQAAELFRMELDPKVRLRRARMVSLPSVYESVETAVTQAQQRLVSRIADRNLVFEINPSSNLATSAIDDLTQHPFFGIHEAAEGQHKKVRVTINCDDPGTFGTRLENEYALMARAIETRYGPQFRKSSVEMIKEMINWAREATFSEPDNSP